MLLSKLTKWDWLVAALSAVALLLFGVILGFFWYAHEFNQARHWHLSPEVSFQLDPLSLISALISSAISFILAIVILRTLSNKDEEARVERKLLIDHFNTFDSEFIEKIRGFAAGGCNVTNVAAVLKRYSVRMQGLCRLGVQHQLLKEDSEATKALMEKIRDIVPMLTDTPKAGAVEDGIRVEGDGKLFYSHAQTDKIAQATFDISSAIFEVMVEINRR